MASLSMFPEQSTAPSTPRAPDVQMHTPVCATEDVSVQKGESVQIAAYVAENPSSQRHLDEYGTHTQTMTQKTGLSEENRSMHHAAENLRHSVQTTNINVTYEDPSFSFMQVASSEPTSTPTTTPLLLTYENNKEEVCVQHTSKEIVKVSTNEDDNKKLASFESPRVLPCVGAFTVQCALCMKWRLIPTKEQYEEIRQSVLEKPFFCSSAASWRPDVSCEDPSDVLQDESHLWAIDRPNIPVAPPGWERQLVIRAAGASKFADVYYVAPSGRKLRSMPEVERFLAEFPEYGRAGVKHSQFSFIIPRPLDSNYCRRKTAGPSSLNANGSESQKKPLSTSKSKNPQVKKLSVKRKAFESLSSIEDTEELDGRKKLLGAAIIPEKSVKGSGMGSSYDDMISQQVVKGSLPPEELMKGLFWPRSGNLDHASSSGTLQLSTNVSQSEAPLQEKS